MQRLLAREMLEQQGFGDSRRLGKRRVVVPWKPLSANVWRAARRIDARRARSTAGVFLPLPLTFIVVSVYSQSFEVQSDVGFFSSP